MSSSHQFTMPIQSPYTPFTLPSIHTYHVVHSPCHPVRIMVHAIHLPCHPFTVSASHHVIPALSHPITPRWRDLRSLTRKSSLSCWRPPWLGAPATRTRSSSPFLPVLPSPPACTLWPSSIPLPITSSLQLEQLRSICIKDLKICLILNLIMVKAILVFAIVVFDSVLILSLVMPKNYSISVVYSFLLILQILCKFQSFMRTWQKTLKFSKILPLYFYFIIPFTWIKRITKTIFTREKMVFLLKSS